MENLRKRFNKIMVLSLLSTSCLILKYGDQANATGFKKGVTSFFSNIFSRSNSLKRDTAGTDNPIIGENSKGFNIRRYNGVKLDSPDKVEVRNRVLVDIAKEVEKNTSVLPRERIYRLLNHEPDTLIRQKDLNRVYKFKDNSTKTKINVSLDKTGDLDKVKIKYNGKTHKINFKDSTYVEEKDTRKVSSAPTSPVVARTSQGKQIGDMVKNFESKSVDRSSQSKHIGAVVRRHDSDITNVSSPTRQVDDIVKNLGFKPIDADESSSVKSGNPTRRRSVITKTIYLTKGEDEGLVKRFIKENKDQLSKEATGGKVFTVKDGDLDLTIRTNSNDELRSVRIQGEKGEVVDKVYNK